MKDVTSTSFGLVIAWLLPGLSTFYCISLWSDDANKVLGSVLTAESTVGLFVMVMLAGVALSLLVTLPRWLLFEELIGRKTRLADTDYRVLKDEQRLTAFRQIVEWHYRYHQFWGSIAIVAPFGFVGWIKSSWQKMPWGNIAIAIIAFVLAEAMIAIGAWAAYKKFVARANSILKGD